MIPHLQAGSGFLCAQADYATADWVILGVPMDYTTSFRPGTRLAPPRIREASLMGMEWYSPAADADLNERKFYDAGDLDLVIGDAAASLNCIREATIQLLADRKRPLLIGGEHLLSLASIEAVAACYPDLVVLHFDAHTDLRQEFFGNELSHATVMRHAYKSLKPGHMHQFGIRSGDRAEFTWAAANISQHRDEVLEPLIATLPQIKDLPVYISLDIDVLDPAYAPGTGTPEAGGITSREMLAAIKAMAGLNIVAMDLVEVSPLNDPDGRTSVLAAKIIREALLEFTKIYQA